MEFSEALEKLQGNSKVMASLKAALDKNATTDELAAILTDVGLGAEEVECLLAEYQQKRGTTIALQQLNDDELEQVAGGSTSMDCDELYAKHNQAVGKNGD